MAEAQFKHIQCHSEQGVFVVNLLDKQLRGDELADALRQGLTAAVREAGTKGVVLILRAGAFLWSSGFRPLLSLGRHLQGGGLVLCTLAQMIADVLPATRLISTSGSSMVPFEAA